MIDRTEQIRAAARAPRHPEGAFWTEAEDPWQGLTLVHFFSST